MRLKIPLILPLVMAGALVPLAVIGEKEVSSEAEARIRKAVPSVAPAKPKAKRKVLVFSVTNGFHHRSIPTGLAAM